MTNLIPIAKLTIGDTIRIGTTTFVIAGEKTLTISNELPTENRLFTLCIAKPELYYVVSVIHGNWYGYLNKETGRFYAINSDSGIEYLDRIRQFPLEVELIEQEYSIQTHWAHVREFPLVNIHRHILAVGDHMPNCVGVFEDGYFILRSMEDLDEIFEGDRKWFFDTFDLWMDYPKYSLSTIKTGNNKC